MPRFGRGGGVRTDALFLRLTFCVLAGSGAACEPDYSLFGDKSPTDKEDTGDTGFLGEGEGGSACYRLKQEYDFLTELGWCRLVNTEGVAFKETLTGAIVQADPGTPFPGTTTPILINGDEDASNPYTSYPGTPNFQSSEVYGLEAGDTSWTAEALAADGTLGTLGACSGSCAWDWLAVDIYDPTRAAAGDCVEYVSPELRVCLVGASPLRATAPAQLQPMAPRAASCIPGAGEFRLMPLHTIDDRWHPVRIDLLRPLQISGDGMLTADSLITSIDADARLATRLRVMAGREHVTMSPENALLSSPTVGEFQAGSARTPRGEVYGGTTFLLETPHGEEPTSAVVNLAWTCPERAAHEGLKLPAGYTVRGSEIGCLGGWSQALTFRPEGSQDRGRRIGLEVYGMPSLARTTKLRPGGEGETFSFKVRGIHIAGALLSEVPGVGAEFRLDEVSYHGVPVCQPGRYHAAAE